MLEKKVIPSATELLLKEIHEDRDQAWTELEEFKEIFTPNNFKFAFHEKT